MELALYDAGPAGTGIGVHGVDLLPTQVEDVMRASQA
jgi:hypothetical protein